MASQTPNRGGILFVQRRQNKLWTLPKNKPKRSKRLALNTRGICSRGSIKEFEIKKRRKSSWYSSDEPTHAQVFLDDDICKILGQIRSMRFLWNKALENLPLTAPMTNLIWVVSVAQVKWV